MLDMTISFSGNLKVDAQVGDFLIQTDQPKAEGGDGAAPEPFALFLASIGTCAAFYVLRFCQSRNIETEGIRLTQENDWDKENKRVTQIRLKVHLPKGFPEKYKKAVIRSADQCTVKRGIFDPPEFVLDAVIE